MNSNGKPLIAITMGDPAGIGPEVTARALMDKQVHQSCRPFVIGSAAAMDDALHIIRANASIRVKKTIEDIGRISGTIDIMDASGLDYGSVQKGQTSAESGRASIQWVLAAGELAGTGKIDAIVTAPINKESCMLAGCTDIGHMEIFQKQSGTRHVATMLMTGNLKVVHLSTHRSLRMACDYVTARNVLSTIQLTDKSLREWGFHNPRIGVAALNPHAGEGGLLGNEEKKHIAPAIEKARSVGINVVGPRPADIIFNEATNGIFDVVLAMYHDQGHIPIKMYGWSKSITLNLGLPFIRTSVDHGTAFDVAGKGIADHESMLEAIRVAAKIATSGSLI